MDERELLQKTVDRLGGYKRQLHRFLRERHPESYIGLWIRGQREIPQSVIKEIRDRELDIQCIELSNDLHANEAKRQVPISRQQFLSALTAILDRVQGVEQRMDTGDKELANELKELRGALAKALKSATKAADPNAVFFP